MKVIDRIIEGKYWIVYYFVYMICVGVGAWLYWPEMFGSSSDKISRLYVMAAVVGLAAGLALLVVVILEVTGRMVLLIPAAWRKAKKEGRDAERERVRAIMAQYGQEDPETGAIVLSREARERLSNGSEDAG